MNEEYLNAVVSLFTNRGVVVYCVGNVTYYGVVNATVTYAALALETTIGRVIINPANIISVREALA